MRLVIYVIMHQAGKLSILVVLLAFFYVWARILVLHYILCKARFFIHRHTKNFPPDFFIPLLYFATITCIVMPVHEGGLRLSWIYAVPVPLTLHEDTCRMIGVPLYAFVIAITSAIRNLTSINQSELHQVKKMRFSHKI